jgi:hypothetical protein
VNRGPHDPAREIFGQLQRGVITVRPRIARYDDEKVEFTDGSHVRADLVVLAAGYKVVFPFLALDVLSGPATRSSSTSTSSTPATTTWPSWGWCRPSGRTSGWHGPRRIWSAIGWRGGTRSPPSRRCARRSPSTPAPCASATSPHPATPCRWTTTTTSAASRPSYRGLTGAAPAELATVSSSTASSRQCKL